MEIPLTLPRGHMIMPVRVLFYFVFVQEFEGEIPERLGRFVYVSEVVSHLYLDVGLYHALIVGWS